MSYSAPEMLFPENFFRKLLILRNTFIDCHSHLSKHQGDQPSSARSSHKVEDMMRMQLVDIYVAICEELMDLDHQCLENEQ